MFHYFRKCLGTSNGLILVGEAEMDGNTLGERCSNMIMDIVSTTLSLHDAEGSLTRILS